MSTISQALLHNLSKLNQETSKTAKTFDWKKNSMFNYDTRGFAGWSASPEFPSFGGLSGPSSTIFVLYSNDLPSEALSLHYQYQQVIRQH